MMNLIILISLTLFSTTIHAATFEVVNRCSYTVWAAAIPGGGKRTTMARVWGRTNCNFDGNGQGQCATGDCNRVLECRGWGSPPNTLAEYALNQPNNLDYLDISLVDGFNIPMDFSPSTGRCRGIRCSADINGQY
ncbi:osmotin-like protein OSM34 [Manihot esculenta]|uniref:osmotin-like protein OSM34 n=1 Tax=Manihot esculenta TaxID=3983 RepID=UPI001CC4619D|nr:osmotin-like protein OSM34 [Manihot esculenta]